MGKLIMWNLVTIDGFFEGKNKWELDWHEYAWGEELEHFSIEQLKSADMLIFGNVTYTGMANYWTTAEGEIANLMNSIPKVVISDTPITVVWNNTKIISHNVVEEITKLKELSAKDIYVFGSAILCDTLIKNNLFDEYRICVTPVLLGERTPLFKPQPKKLRMELLWTKTLKTGAVILCYKPL
ncbi:MAG: dihydrofolate reductase family protein [Deltaproteobacteria bacterium]